MTADFPVLLDACVLANLQIPVREVITRLADPVPAFALQVADDIGIELG